VTVGGEEDGQKFGEYREHTFKDKHVAVDNVLQARAGDAKVLVGGGDGKGNLDFYVEGDVVQTVDGESRTKIKKNRFTAVDGQDAHEVNEDFYLYVQKCLGIRALDHACLSGGQQATVVAPEISLGADSSNFIRIGPSGVTIVGTVVNINSGGQRLSGFAGDPDPLPDAEKAAPTAPAAADDAKTGQKSS
jgi:type VI secretion system secreted protein VgrG